MKFQIQDLTSILGVNWLKKSFTRTTVGSCIHKTAKLLVNISSNCLVSVNIVA